MVTEVEEYQEMIEICVAVVVIRLTMKNITTREMLRASHNLSCGKLYCSILHTRIICEG